ncbi:preprotein translocase subunit YajC [Brevibacterium casei]|uniref:preprotein translocase subunit YajC n=1 Tax=Brevibacterium casei TaxID=33889 RepID=UPI003F823970
MDLLIPLALAALLIFFLFNSRRKQKARAEQIKAGLVPGAKVMTTFGVFGTVLSINDEDNQVTIESGPGTILKVHRQAIGQIENPETDVAPIADDAESPAITDAELDAMNERKRAEGNGDVDAAKADETAQADDIDAIAKADADANTAEALKAEDAKKADADPTGKADTTNDKKAVDGLNDDTAAGDESKKPGSTPDSDDKKN